MAIKTRQTTATGVTNNNAPLTNAEVDNNFVELQQNKVSTSGDTITGNLLLEDDVELKFGAFSGGDLRIYHDSSAPKSVIAEQGGGPLELRTSQLNMTTEDGTEDVLRANASSVKLYGSNAVVLNATSTGVDVTGDLDATGTVSGAGLTVKQDGATSIVFGEKAGGDSTTVQIGKGYDQTSQIIFEGSSNTWSGIYADASEHIIISLDQNESLTNPASFHVKGAGQNKSHFEVSETSDVKFYNTAGDTAQVEWTAASQLLNVTGTVQADKFTNDEALPDVRPSLLLDFANQKALDPRITFARGSTATYWDGHTTTKAEENLILYSQSFGNAAWNKQNITVTSENNTAPDGTSTAALLTTTTVNPYDQVWQEVQVVSGETYTLSCFFKAGTSTLTHLGAWGDSNNFTQLWFDWSGGVPSFNSTSKNYIAGSEEFTDYGNGWYRISFSFVATSTDGWDVAIQPDRDDLARTVYAWGFQLERRSSVTAYTPTTSSPIVKHQPVLQTAAADEARFDHDPLTGESKGLMMERDRTNYVSTSETLNSYLAIQNASWRVNDVIAPDGTQTADVLVASTDTNVFHRAYVYKTLSSTNTISIFAKAQGYNFIRMGQWNPTSGLVDWVGDFDLVNGTSSGTGTYVDDTSIEDVGNGWFRCSVWGTYNSGSGIVINLCNTNGGTYFTGDGFSGVALWGLQYEVGDYPTSYIPTSGSDVTRARDFASIEDISGFYNQVEGTTQITTIDGHFDQNARLFAFDNGATTDFYGIQTSTDTSSRLAVNALGASQAANSPSVTNWQVENKFAVSVKTDDIRNQGPTIAYDDTSAILPIVTRLQIGGLANGFGVTATIKKFAYYPKQLPDATLAAMVED